MKNIRHIQYTKVQQLYRELLSFRGEKPNQDSIDQLAHEILYSTLRTPLCGKYRLPRHSVIDTNALNVECGLIKADSETIYEYLHEVQRKIRTMKYVADVWKQYAEHKVKSTMIELAKLTSPAFIHGFTEELNPTEILSQENTTLIVDSDGSITLPMVVNTARRYKHTISDISIRPIGDNLTASILGRTTSIVNIEEHGSLTLSLAGAKITEAGFEITINTDMEAINYIYLKMSNIRNGVKIHIQITENKKEYTTVYNGIITRNQVDIPINETDVSRIICTITMTMPNIVLANEVRYEFTIDKLLMLSDKRKLTGRFETKEIAIEDDIAFISIAAEDETIGNAVIKYYLATEKDTSNKPTGFFYIDPHLEKNIIYLTSNSQHLSIAPSSDVCYRWSLPGIKDYGSRLYNILDICGPGEIEYSESVTIADGRIVIDQGEIIKDTMKLYRGVGDYVKKEKSVRVERYVDWITIVPEINESISWVHRISFRITVTDIIESKQVTHAGGAFNNQIRVPYSILNYEEIKIHRDDGREINTIITHVAYTDGNTLITCAANPGTTFLNPSYRYHISYIVSLKEYASAHNLQIEIVPDSVRVNVGNDELLYGIDFTIYRHDLEIELKKSGRYLSYYTSANGSTMCTPVVMSYTFTAQSENSTIYYETHVYVDTPMEIIIRPFTTSELSYGNFHSINSEQVSTKTRHELMQGWNCIETTQPFPSRNEYDTNLITGLPSSAGIVIPENTATMRAYRDSMRQVAPFALATLDREEGATCFAFVDGMILINFLPTFIEDVFLTDEHTADIKGDQFLNKKALWGVAYENSGWISHPETFLCEFSYTGDDVKTIFLRIDIICQDTSSIGRVFRIGLNKFKEV